MELYVQSRTGEHVPRVMWVKKGLCTGKCHHHMCTRNNHPWASEDGAEGTGGWWRCLEKTGRLRRQEIRRKSWGMLSLNTSQLHKINRQNKRTLGNRVEDQGERTVMGTRCREGRLLSSYWEVK